MPDARDDSDLALAAVNESELSGPAPESGSAESRDLVVRSDSKGVMLYVSDSCRRFGYEPSELVGRTGVDFVHPDDFPRFAANSARLFGSVTPDEKVNREFRYRRKDGSWAWLEGHPTILPSFDGRLGDVLNVFCDVTEQREMGEALRAQARDARSR